MIKEYVIMKKNEWRVKGAIYGTIASVMDNQKEIIEFVQKLYDGLKDIPVEDMQKEFVSKIAELVHDDKDE